MITTKTNTDGLRPATLKATEWALGDDLGPLSSQQITTGGQLVAQTEARYSASGLLWVEGQLKKFLKI
jgi:hypothetical protein